MTDTSSQSTEFSLPETVHPGRVCLLVNDLDRLTGFYRDVVGLRVLVRDAGRTVLGVDGPLLELRGDPTASERGPSESGLFHVAFRVPSRVALADALGRVRERWRLTGASDHRVSEALYFRDPEGNGIEVYHDRPRDAWPVAADGSVDMGTRALDLEDLTTLTGDGSSLPSGTDIGHVHLEVSSLAAANDFYVNTLGMNRRAAYDDSASFLAAGDYHHHLGLNVWNGRSAPRTGRGLQWFSLVVPDETTLDSVTARVGADDVENAGGERRVDLPDPRGVELRLRVADDAPDDVSDPESTAD